jgi:hypothetical protein
MLTSFPARLHTRYCILSYEVAQQILLFQFSSRGNRPQQAGGGGRLSTRSSDALFHAHLENGQKTSVLLHVLMVAHSRVDAGLYAQLRRGQPAQLLPLQCVFLSPRFC